MKKEFQMEIAIKNIIAIRRKAKPQDVADGIAWYAKAYEECRIIAERFDLPIHMVVGVVSALSPNNRWETNIINARDVIETWDYGYAPDTVSVCTYNAMKLKAFAILDGGSKTIDEVKAILNGKKIVCFFENILGEDTCTIDGHARNIAYNQRVNLTDGKTSIGKLEYANLQEAYLQASKRCSVNGRRLKAYELQAITWVTWRKMHNIA